PMLRIITAAGLLAIGCASEPATPPPNAPAVPAQTWNPMPAPAPPQPYALGPTYQPPFPAGPVSSPAATPSTSGPDSVEGGVEGARQAPEIVAPAPPPAPPPVPFGKGMTRPTFISGLQPGYTQEARDACVE